MAAARGVFWLLLLTLLGPGLWGCRTPEPRPPEAVRARAEAQAQQAPPSMFDRISMTPEQRQKVAELSRELERDFALYEASRQRLLDEVVAEVRAGALDPARLEPRIDETVGEFEKARPALVRFTNGLFALFSKKQRERFIAVWNGDDESMSEEERQKKHESGLSQVIDLTGGQKARLFPAMLPVYWRHHGVISDYRNYSAEAKKAFVEGPFDAGQQKLFTDLRLRELGRAMLEGAQIAMGILSHEQKQTLAAYVDTEWR